MVILCLIGSGYMAVALPADSPDKFFFQAVTVVFLVVALWFGKNVKDVIDENR